MKKLTVAALILAAISAHAQSSVTLFGVVDAVIQRPAGQGSGSITRLAGSGNSSSRIGLRGVEDLGGGLSAGFWLEAGITNDSGIGQASNTNNQTSRAPAAALVSGQGLTFNRRSTVSLTGNFGEVRIGRDFTPSYLNLGSADPFMNLGSGQAAFLTISGGGTVGSPAGSTLPTAARASNSITYFLPPDLGGLYGSLMIALGENASTAGATKNDGRYTGFRLGYAGSLLGGGIAHGVTKYATGDYLQESVTGLLFWNGGTFSAQWSRDEFQRTPAAKADSLLLGVKYPLGQHELKASIIHTDVANSPNDARMWVIGDVYNLSKRTALYTTYSRIKNKGTGVLFHNGLRASVPGGRTSGLDLGVRHSF